MAEVKRSFEATIKWALTQAGSFADLEIERDVTLTEEWDEADSTARGDGGDATSEPTIRRVTIEFDQIYDPTNAGYQALENAAHTRTPLAFQIVDDDGRGLQGDFKVFNFTRNEGLADVMTNNVMLKPCKSDTPMSWLAP